MATQAEIKYALKRPRLYPGYIYWFMGVVNAFWGYGTYMYAWGVFVPYFRRDFKLTNSEIGLVNTVQRIDSGIEAPIAGYFLDTRGPKWVVCIGMCFAAVGYALVAWWPVGPGWHAPWLWFTKGIMIAIMGQAGLYFSSAKLETWYFIKNRGRMMALKTVGAAFGGMVLVSMTEMLAQGVWGWRGAAWVSAAGFLALVPLNFFFLTNKPPQHYGLLPDNEKLPHERTKEELEAAKAKGFTRVMTADDFLPALGVRDAMKTRAFWTFAASGALAGFTAFGTQTWFVSHLRAEGYTSGMAAFYYAMFFPATVIGRIIAAIWADKVSPRWFYTYQFFGQSIPTIFLALFAQNTLIIWMWVVWYGASFGMSPALGTHLRASYFGRKWYATIGGMVQLIDIGFGAVGPFIVGWAADYTKSYRVSFLLMAGVWFLSGLIWSVMPTTPKVMQEAKRKAREAGIRVV